jgi:hypothetical protein
VQKKGIFVDTLRVLLADFSGSKLSATAPGRAMGVGEAQFTAAA